MSSTEEIRERDLWMLKELVAADVDDNDDDDRASWDKSECLSSEEHDAFADMLEKSGHFATLTTKQRSWAEQVCRRLDINTTPPSQRKAVPRGADVELAEVLRVLPKRPPQARRPQ